MRALEDLKKQWNDAARFRGVRVNLCLEPDGVRLGAGTIIAKRSRDGSLAVDGEEARVLTLLSVACGRVVDPPVLVSLRRASALARSGDECKAAMLLALVKLPKIADPKDAARRLFIADGLMAKGVEPIDIWKSLDFDPALLDSLCKFDPDEPRVPAGSGKPSGEWTNGATVAAADAVVSLAARFVGEAAETARPVASRVVERLPEFAARAARIGSQGIPFLDVLEDVLDPSDTGGVHLTGPVRGHPNLHYSRYQDELALRVIDASDPRRDFVLGPTAVRGQYANPQKGVVAHMDGSELVLDTMSRAVSEITAERSEPELCPEPPVPDKTGMTGPRSERSKGYEQYMRMQINPDLPTPMGLTYGLVNPSTGRLVRFDDCEHDTGNMIEFKGLGYANMLSHPFMRANIARQWLAQAMRQVLASDGRPIRWYFAEKGALDFARALFAMNPLLSGIELDFAPWLDGERWKWTGKEWRRLLSASFWRKRFAPVS